MDGIVLFIRPKLIEGFEQFIYYCHVCLTRIKTEIQREQKGLGLNWKQNPLKKKQKTNSEAKILQCKLIFDSPSQRQ